jgi:Listeria/Bacterioides repeat
LYPTIDFYGGSVSNVLAPFSEATYRIFVPPDATRWKHTSTHVLGVGLYLENGYLPTKTASDDWRSTTANSTLNQYLLGGWPWEPDANYFLTLTNTTSSAQPYSFTMDGRNAVTDDNDLDGMPDAWERFYFAGSTSPTAAGDYDGDGVSNLNEYLEGTNPADAKSFNPRLTVSATNGVVNVNPVAPYYTQGASVGLTALPNAGYVFVGWTGDASGNANPLNLVMTTNRVITAVFRSPGDDFAQRVTITSWSNTVTGVNTNATKEIGEPNHAGNAGGHSVWWTWTALSSGNVTITTAGSSFNTLLAVYTGSSVTNLSSVAANDNDGTNNTSGLTFTAVAGVAYAIAVDGFSGASGSIVLQVKADTAPIILGSPVRLGDGRFQFTLSAEAGYNYDIQASSNMVTWVTIATLPNPAGVLTFIDPNASLYSMRYYRASRALTVVQPVTLINPLMLGNGQFSMVVSGPTRQVFQIEASSNLIDWSALVTLTNTNGAVPFIDSTATGQVRRFYRVFVP